MNVKELNKIKINIEEEKRIEINKIINRYYDDLDFSICRGEINNKLLSEYIMNIAECFIYFEDQEYWLKNVNVIMKRIKEILESNIYTMRPSLFSGISEIGFSIFLLYTNTGYYRNFWQKLNETLYDIIEYNLCFLDNQMENMKTNYYDVIYGMSGIAVYLLLCEESDKRNKVLEHIAKYLIDILLGKHKVNNNVEPNWYIRYENQMSEEEKRIFPKGNFNLGYAHGIAGIMVALSKISAAGINLEDQNKAIEESIRIYMKYGTINDNIYLWPERLGYEEYYTKEKITFQNERQSWCYGAIGISRAIYLTGSLLENKFLKEFGYNNIVNIAKLPIESYHLSSPILCHGYSGISSILYRTYKEKPTEILSDKIKELLTQILSLYDEKSQFGFKDIKFRQQKFVWMDDNTFLEGTSGIILYLLSLFKADSLYDKHIVII